LGAFFGGAMFELGSLLLQARRLFGVTLRGFLPDALGNRVRSLRGPILGLLLHLFPLIGSGTQRGGILTIGVGLLTEFVRCRPVCHILSA
jgi:hypothetical protein